MSKIVSVYVEKSWNLVGADSFVYMMLTFETSVLAVRAILPPAVGMRVAR